jgi:hypothetical protein
MKKIIVCSIFLALGWIYSPSTYASNCLKDVTHACKQKYQQAGELCQKQYGYSHINATCRKQRTEALNLCRQEYNSANQLCRRQTPSKSQNEHCSQLKTEAEAKCIKPDRKMSHCTTKYETCHKSCFRECVICTREAVRLCNNICREQDRFCRISEKIDWQNCINHAKDLEKNCKNKLQLDSWENAYQCRSKALQKQMQCNWAAWDKYNNCIYIARNQLQNCNAQRSIAQATCIYQDFIKCVQSPPTEQPTSPKADDNQPQPNQIPSELPDPKTKTKHIPPTDKLIHKLFRREPPKKTTTKPALPADTKSDSHQ